MLKNSLKAAGIWFVILVCAVLNGALRQAVLLPLLGTTAAFLMSGLLLSTCIVAIALWLVPKLDKMRPAQAFHIGALWLGLTLAFEFGFGVLVMHHPLRELLEAYTFKDGNIWPLVLVVTFLAPALGVRLRNRE